MIRTFIKMAFGEREHRLIFNKESGSQQPPPVEQKLEVGNKPPNTLNTTAGVSGRVTQDVGRATSMLADGKTRIAAASGMTAEQSSGRSSVINAEAGKKLADFLGNKPIAQTGEAIQGAAQNAAKVSGISMFETVGKHVGDKFQTAQGYVDTGTQFVRTTLGGDALSHAPDPERKGGGSTPNKQSAQDLLSEAQAEALGGESVNTAIKSLERNPSLRAQLEETLRALTASKDPAAVMALINQVRPLLKGLVFDPALMIDRKGDPFAAARPSQIIDFLRKILGKEKPATQESSSKGSESPSGGSDVGSAMTELAEANKTGNFEKIVQAIMKLVAAIMKLFKGESGEQTDSGLNKDLKGNESKAELQKMIKNKQEEGTKNEEKITNLNTQIDTAVAERKKLAESKGAPGADAAKLDAQIAEFDKNINNLIAQRDALVQKNNQLKREIEDLKVREKKVDQQGAQVKDMLEGLGPLAKQLIGDVEITEKGIKMAKEGLLTNLLQVKPGEVVPFKQVVDKLCTAFNVKDLNGLLRTTLSNPNTRRTLRNLMMSALPADLVKKVDLANHAYKVKNNKDAKGESLARLRDWYLTESGEAGTLEQIFGGMAPDSMVKSKVVENYDKQLNEFSAQFGIDKDIIEKLIIETDEDAKAELASASEQKDESPEQ